MVSLRGLIAIRTWLRSVVASPMASPLPRNASASAVSTALSLVTSILFSTVTKFWNTVFTSVVTLRDSTTAPAVSRFGLGSVGVSRSTYLAPNAVVAVILAATLAGMYL